MFINAAKDAEGRGVELTETYLSEILDRIFSSNERANDEDED